VTVAVAVCRRLSPAFQLDVTFEAPAGVTILFGASGSGKTTVLRSIAGLIRPDEGRIAVGDRVLFDGNTSTDVPVQERQVGYVFQQLALFPHLSVEDNIAYGLSGRPVDERRSRVAAVADSFDLLPLLRRKPTQISGGERQRAALARALVTDPSVLLLDEPLSALDHVVQLRMMDDLRLWNEARQIPVLYVTHTHREVYALGDRVVALEGGRVLATGSPHDVLDHPTHGVLASLAGFENIFDAVVVDRRERSGTMQCRLYGTAAELEVPLAAAAVGQMIRVAIRAGDILLSSQEPIGLSARNVLRGEITLLSTHGPTVVAAVEAGGVRFIVHLTPGGAEALELHRGTRLWLVIKTYSCRLVSF
jgi:molybdate transport system ATP-binding protein